jgi:hypothetical protein
MVASIMKSFTELLCGPPGVILFGALVTAIGALWASQQQAGFERNLRAKSDEIAGLNREIANLITGGESFCYMDIGSLDPDTNRGIPVIVQQGDHSIFDINARIVDLQEFRQIKGNTFEGFNKAQRTLQIGSLAKGTCLAMSPLDLGDSPERDFNIFFIARNGQFTELLRLRKIDAKWARAIRVKRGSELLFEKVDDDFPKTDQGQIQWLGPPKE